MIHEENGQIIVDELRPMSDAPRNGRSIFCILNGSVNLREMYFKEGFWRIPDTSLHFKDNHIEGYIPMPTYRPKDGA